MQPAGPISPHTARSFCRARTDRRAGSATGRWISSVVLGLPGRCFLVLSYIRDRLFGTQPCRILEGTAGRWAQAQGGRMSRRDQVESVGNWSTLPQFVRTLPVCLAATMILRQGIECLHRINIMLKQRQQFRPGIGRWPREFCSPESLATKM